MKVIKLKRYLPDTARGPNHKSSQKLERFVKDLAESNEGKLDSFEVAENGTALLFVLGDKAIDFIVKEFERMPDVEIETLSPAQVYREQNIAIQQRAEKMRASKKKAAG